AGGGGRVDGGGEAAAVVARAVADGDRRRLGLVQLERAGRGAGGEGDRRGRAEVGRDARLVGRRRVEAADRGGAAEGEVLVARVAGRGIAVGVVGGERGVVGRA